MGDATRPAPDARFWAKVKVGEQDECWPWQGAKIRGYGSLRRDNQHHYAHRMSYESAKGPVPDGLVVDHLCHNADPSCREGDNCPHRACVNPAHLEVTTRGENRRRAPIAGMAAIHAAKTHCKQGHPLSGDNLIKTTRQRACRTCHRKVDREWARRKRSQNAATRAGAADEHALR